MTKRTVLRVAMLLGMSWPGMMAGRMYAMAPLSEAYLYSFAPEDAAYTDGMKAMNDQRWQDAVAAFDKVIQAKDKRTDAAIYWKAYSLRKLGNVQAAKANCDQLRAQFSGSAWNRDCAVLTLDGTMVRLSDGSTGDTMAIAPPDGSKPRLLKHATPIQAYATGATGATGVGPGWDGGRDPDADIKLLAMNSLLNQDPAKAIPLLRGMLAGNQPASVKQHALFVLSQSKAPEAETVMHDAILGKMGAEVQTQAIQSSGVFLRKRDNAMLVEVYRSSSDVSVKRSVISALFISHDAPRLVELAKSEKDLNLKRNIVSQLALMKDQAATDYMMELLK